MSASDDVEVIDIEEYSARGEAPPKGRRYRFRVDKKPFVSDRAEITGEQILALAGMDPQAVDLFQAIRGGQRIPIAAGMTVDLTTPGVERFFTLKNEHSNGYEPSHRAFELPVEDCAYLRSTGLCWETLIDANQRWLVIRDWPLPQGFTVSSASVALRIDPNYPLAQIDMAYFAPTLVPTQGVAIPALTTILIQGQSWQQWSRHRPANAWRPGVDGIESHLAYVENFLTAALRTG